MAVITTPVAPLMQQQAEMDVRPYKQALAKAEIWAGLKMVAIGSVITGITYAIAPPGGIFLVSFAPLFGVFHMLRGLFRLAAA